MLRRFLVLLFVAIMLSWALSACGGAAPTPEATAPVIEAPTTEPSVQATPVEAVPVATAEVDATAATPVTSAPDAAPPQIDTANLPPSVAPKLDSSAMVADLGFRADVNGLPFENYGADKPVTNLTPVEVRRMFGDGVCARLSGDTCVLTPPAEQWMEQANAAMKGGHCEGFATLSLLLYKGLVNVKDLGADQVANLQLDGNERLQREIAYWFITQATQPAANAIQRGTPAQIVDMLKQGYAKGNASETYTVGIYKPDRTDGHAVTAYGLVDRGNGVYWIMVYDNNYPKQERYIEVDTNANTWKYEASINPSVAPMTYEGNADTMTLEIVPSSPRLEKQVCFFCSATAAQGSSGRSLAEPAQLFHQLWMDGNADLLILDEQQHRLGFENGKFYNEIPNATYIAVRGGDDLAEEDVSPIFNVPSGKKFAAVIDGNNLKSKDDPTELALIGPGFYLGVSNILMDPGEKDYLTLSADGHSIAYKTDYAETPNIIVGVERPQADYELELVGTEVLPGSETMVDLDPEKGTLTFYSTSDQLSKFSVNISRISDEDTETFEGTDLDLNPHDKIIFAYGEWNGQGKSLKVMYDQGGDGTIDETVDMADQK